MPPDNVVRSIHHSNSRHYETPTWCKVLCPKCSVHAPDANTLCTASLCAGTSAETAAIIEAQAPYLLSGSPPPTDPIYPDTDAGNLGLCKLMASQEVMPQAPVLSKQLLGQNPAIFDYLNEPSSAIYNSLGNITNPVLVIHGSQDQDVAVQDGYTLVNKIPGASFLQFADAAHGAILQHAVTAGQVVSAFLDQ